MEPRRRYLDKQRGRKERLIPKDLSTLTMAFEEDVMGPVVWPHDQSIGKQVVQPGASNDAARAHSETA